LSSFRSGIGSPPGYDEKRELLEAAAAQRHEVLAEVREVDQPPGAADLPARVALGDVLRIGLDRDRVPIDSRSVGVPFHGAHGLSLATIWTRLTTKLQRRFQRKSGIQQGLDFVLISKRILCPFRTTGGRPS
jgi:hypothetical protein